MTAMPSPRLHPAPGGLVEELDGRLLLLAPGRTHVLVLDEVATRVWQELAAGPTVEELVQAVAGLYAAPPGRVADDLAPVLVLLREHGALLEQSDGPDRP